MFQKTVRGVLLGLMMVLLLTSGMVIGAEKKLAEDLSALTSNATKGEILLATSQGVSIIEEDGWSVLDKSKGLPHNRVKTTAVDKEGRIWVSHGSGLSVLDGGQWSHYLRFEMYKTLGFSINDIDVLAFDAQGRVWIGTDWELAVFDGNQWLTYTQATSGLAGNGVNAITLIGDGPPSFPLPSEAQPGSVSGKVTCQEVPVVGAEVNICWDVSWPIFFGPTPCKGEVYKAVTDSEGCFCIVNIPIGAYKLAMRIMEEEKEKWYTGGGIGNLPATLHIISGEETRLAELSLKK